MRHYFTKISILATTLLLVLGTGGAVFADDGELVRKSMSRLSGNPSLDAVPEAEHAFIDTMKFYVPAQASDGTVGPIVYTNVDGVDVETRDYAKPLVSVYIYGPVVGVEGVGFVGHGMRDAFAAVSLDDGNTWKSTNLSESADLSSFTVSVPIPDPSVGSGGDFEFQVDAAEPYIEEAEAEQERRGFELEVEGAGADRRDKVYLRNAVTLEVFSRKDRADRDGEWEIEIDRLAEVPCYVQAGIDDVWGPVAEVEFEDDEHAECVGEPGAVTITDYPGDVVNIFQSTAGTYTVAAWPSRYCDSGTPNYSLDTSDPERRDAIAAYLGIDLATPSADDLYLTDMYGVGGAQDSVDYTEDRFEQNQPVGEVPFNCLWTARGVLLQGDDPRTEAAESSYMRWFKAERLTSGTRDVNRIEVSCVGGAGCAITWQEDPEGLRPGQGEGPGEGWSGAIANSQTDVWYSYIKWDNFAAVEDPADDTNILTIDEWLLTGDETKPQVGVPFAMPMRVTDNARCNVTNPQPYCNGSAIQANHTDVLNPLDYGLPDMCAATVSIPTGPNNTLSDICVTENDLPLVGNIAATRPRLGLQGYDSDADGSTDSAWVIFQAEESKGLGAFGFTEDGTACDPDVDGDACIAFDEGKNLWYYSFSMALDDIHAADETGLVQNLAGHGNQLNQPEVDWETGEFYPVRNTSDMWDFGIYNYQIWNTEIARRGSLLSQGLAKIAGSTSKLAALPSWKQGIMNQGGPADVMVRRIVDQGNSANPYAFVNMVCASWLYQDGSNPHYPDGLCMDSAINLSGFIPDTCTDSELGGDVPCPTVDLEAGTTFAKGDTNPILQGLVQGEGNTTKILTWHQCPAEFTTFSGETLNCDTDTRPDDSTLADQSWYNPLDVSKGHRGFLDGDFVMLLYAWSPNWRTNAVGHDRYELYVRRSFDGAQSWTTTPGSFTASDGLSYSGDGTVSCETFRSEITGAGDVEEPRVCNEYAAGAPEQSRNVTQHQSMRITTLDPRYATTGSPRGVSVTADPFATGFSIAEEDVRNPSRFFIVYETGDNSTTAFGEAEPDDLWYSRAVNFGDDYLVWAEETDLSICYPSDPHGDDTVPAELVGSGFCNEFEQMDQGSPGLQASEASLEANPGGQFMYGVWAQWLHDADGELTESDAMARRVWLIDDYISTTFAWDFGQGPQ